jgi:hypothetical protein
MRTTDNLEAVVRLQDVRRILHRLQRHLFQQPGSIGHYIGQAEREAMELAQLRVKEDKPWKQ